MATGGVYEIVNTVDDVRYIGSSTRVAARISRHKSDLKHNRSDIPRLQDDFNRLGEGFFEFNILDRTDDPAELRKEEHMIIRTLGDNDYNLRYVSMEPVHEIGSTEWIKDMQAIIDDVRELVGKGS